MDSLVVHLKGHFGLVTLFCIYIYLLAVVALERRLTSTSIEIIVAKILRLQIQNFQRNKKRKLINSATLKSTRLKSSMNSVLGLHPLAGEDRLDLANCDMEADAIGSVDCPAAAIVEKQEAVQTKTSAVPTTSSQP